MPIGYVCQRILVENAGRVGFDHAQVCGESSWCDVKRDGYAAFLMRGIRLAGKRERGFESGFKRGWLKGEIDGVIRLGNRAAVQGAGIIKPARHGGECCLVE